MTPLPGSPFVNPASYESHDVATAVVSDSSPGATAGTNSVSPGVNIGSLPHPNPAGSGESDPSVTLDFAPGESTCGGVEGHALSYALAPQASAFADALVRPAGINPGPQDQFPPGFDPEKFLADILDPMPAFLAAPSPEYLAAVK